MKLLIWPQRQKLLNQFARVRAPTTEQGTFLSRASSFAGPVTHVALWSLNSLLVRERDLRGSINSNNRKPHSCFTTHSSGSTSRPAPDKAGDVHIDEGGHQVLAVKAIHDASMTRNGIGKILLEAEEG